MRTLGLLIAGGQGRRLGAGVPKARVELAGLTLLQRAMAILAACSDHVRVVAPAKLGLDVPAEMLVEDPPGEQGPLAALVAGLSATTFERAIVLGVDYPLARPHSLAAIAELLAEAPRPHAVVPELAGMLQPLVAAYAPAARDALAARLDQGERSLVAAVRAMPVRLVADAEIAALEGGEENFLNVNTPEDLAAIERRMGARA